MWGDASREDKALQPESVACLALAGEDTLLTSLGLIGEHEGGRSRVFMIEPVDSTEQQQHT